MEKIVDISVEEEIEPVAADEVLERIPKEEADADGGLKDKGLEESVEVEEPKVPEMCPHCGLDPEQPRIEVSESDRKQWMRHILSGGSKRFTKEYKIYGGRVGFKLRSRTGLEDRDIDLATNDFMHSITNISDFNKIRIEMMKIQLLYSLEHIFYIDLENPEEIRRVPIQAPTRNEIEEAWALQKSAAIKKYLAFLEDTPTPIMTLMCDKLSEFNATVSMLTIEGLNPDF